MISMNWSIHYELDNYYKYVWSFMLNYHFPMVLVSLGHHLVGKSSLGPWLQNLWRIRSGAFVDASPTWVNYGYWWLRMVTKHRNSPKKKSPAKFTTTKITFYIDHVIAVISAKHQDFCHVESHVVFPALSLDRWSLEQDGDAEWDPGAAGDDRDGDGDIYIWQCVKTLYPWWTSK